MLAAQRQAHILSLVQRDGAVQVADLTHELGVSDMTIRRDLEAMSDRGLVDKVHGGATAPRGDGRPAIATEEPEFAAKAAQQLGAKKAIAAAACTIIEPGMAIALTGGTTTWALAQTLADIPNLTVVTNSLPVADTLHKTSAHSVILTGGERTPSDALVGPVAAKAVSSLHVDAVFLGVHGIDRDAGLTTPNLTEAETNRAFIAAARRLIVLADHTKWDTVALASIAPLSAVDALVTDRQPPAEAAEAVGEVILPEATS